MDFWYSVQNWLSILGAAATYLLFITVLITVMRKRQFNLFSLQTLAMQFAFATGLLFEINQVHLAFDTFIGINNLSWLLAWLFFTLTFHLIIFVTDGILEAVHLRWLHAFSLITIPLYIWLFWAYLRHTPSFPNHVLPRTWPDFLFLQGLFIPCAIATWQLYHANQIMYRNEKALIVRLRSLGGVLTTGAVTTVFLVRILLTFLAILPSISFILPTLYALSLLLQLSLIIFFGMPYWPTGMLLLLAQPALTLKKLRQLRYLETVQAHVQQFHQPIVKLTIPTSQKERLADLNFYICRTITTILDGKCALNEDADRGSLDPQAASLLALLNQADDNANFTLLTDVYALLGMQLKRLS